MNVPSHTSLDWNTLAHFASNASAFTRYITVSVGILSMVSGIIPSVFSFTQLLIAVLVVSSKGAE